MKFTVPENEVYTLDTSYSETYGDGSWTFTVWSYYDKYDAYVSGGNHLVNSGNYTRRMDRFTEGTYYIAIEGSEELLPIQISLNQMAKIDSLRIVQLRYRMLSYRRVQLRCQSLKRNMHIW